MAKLFVIGICGNSVFMETDHFHKKGETIVAESYNAEYGGKGFNQAVAASRMGAEVSFLGAVGKDAHGKCCEEVLLNEGIKSCLVVKDAITTSAFILTDRCGENQVTVYRGAELSKEDVYTFENEIRDCDILLLQNEVPEEVNITAINLAKKYGKKVILNPAPARELNDDMYKNVYLVTPNEQEAQAIDLGAFRHYIITKGKDGCEIDGKVKIDALSVTALDTTGAGDTFNGVLAVCIAKGMTLADASRYASVASGLSVTKKMVLNSIPHKNEIEEMLKC